MELLEVCESLVQETDGVRACVVLDLQTSLTLAQCLERGFGNADVLQATRIAGGIFRGKLLRQFVRTLPGDRGADGFVREAQVTTAGMHLFMASLAKFPNALLVCVTEKSVNIGMGWMAVHQALDHLREDPPELQAPGGQGAPPPVAKPDFPVTEPGPASSSQPAAAVRPVDSTPAGTECRAGARPKGAITYSRTGSGRLRNTDGNRTGTGAGASVFQGGRTQNFRTRRLRCRRRTG